MINFFGYYVREFGIIRGLIDFIIIFGGIFLYSWLGLGSSGSTTPDEVSPLVLSFVTSLMTWSCIFATGLYDLPYRYNLRNIAARLIAVFMMTIPVTVALWWAVGFAYGNSVYVPVVAITLQLILFFLSRILYMFFLPKDFFHETVVIIAEKSEVKNIYAILERSGNPFKIAKVISPDFTDRHHHFHLADYCLRRYVSTIIIGDIKDMKRLTLFASCRYAGIRVLDINLLREQELGRVNIEKFYSYHLLFNRNFTLNRLSQIAKRLFDIIVASCILILTFPILVLVAILIKCEDGGNIIYTQKRVGLNGIIFPLFKFRSMRIDAEKDGKARWADENDTRITRIGSFIRKTRIDEIPQCLNIVLGHMSIVGPRPERPEFVEELVKKIPLYNERHYIKPGLTGWAQINERYGASVDDARLKLEYDLYYLKHCSIVLDTLILMKTISVVIWPNGVR